jgi:hypothetical protein
MSDSKFIQFSAPVSTAPVPPIRDKSGNIVGGPELEKINAEIDDLARHLHASVRWNSIPQAVSNMPSAYDAALAIVLQRHGCTKKFTEAETARNAEVAAQKARNEKNLADTQKRRAEILEAERIDKTTRQQLADWKPRSSSAQPGSPTWAIEKARFVQSLNELRAKHGLPALSV